MKKGLLPLPKDKRDFSHHRTFGAVSVALPDYFYTQPLEILNQKNTQFCTAFSATEIGESEWDKRFSPTAQAAFEGKVSGKNIAGQGTDLRTACEAMRKIGFLPAELAPYTLDNADEQTCGDWTKLTQAEFDAASKYTLSGYYAVDGTHDTFDNIRYALLAAQQAGEPKPSVLVGSSWYAEWEGISTDGIIPDPLTFVSYHAHRIIGWKTEQGVPYLIDQQTQDTSYGDHGLCYFPRAIVNKCFTEGLYIARKNPDPNQIKTISAILTLMSQAVSLMYRLWEAVKPKPQAIIPDASLPPMTPPAPPPIEQIQPIGQWWELPPEKQSKDWGGRPNIYPENLQQLFILKARQFAKTIGFTPQQEEDLVATIWGESGFNPYCIHKNIVNGKVSSTDFSIAQINDWFHVIKYHDFSSVGYITSHPEECLQWMAKTFQNTPDVWDAHKNGGYKHYLNNFNPYSLGSVEETIIPEKWEKVA